MSKRLAAIFAVLTTMSLIAVFGIGNAGAQYMNCSYPTPPYCVSGFGTFANNNAFQSCRSDVERYLQNVRFYVDCLQRAADAANREANQTVADFNRMAN